MSGKKGLLTASLSFKRRQSGAISEASQPPSQRLPLLSSSASSSALSNAPDTPGSGSAGGDREEDLMGLSSTPPISNNRFAEMLGTRTGGAAEGGEEEMHSSPDKAENPHEFIKSFIPNMVMARLRAGGSITHQELSAHRAVVGFFDVAGFSSLARDLELADRAEAMRSIKKRGVSYLANSSGSGKGAEELVRQLNETLGDLIETIRSAGGDIIKFAGDAILVVWLINDEGKELSTTAKNGEDSSSSSSSSSSHDDLEKRLLENATRCALACVNLKRGSSSTLGLHVGLGVGELVAAHVGGNFGRWEFFIAGDACSQSAAAEGKAGVDEVVLSPQAVEVLKRRRISSFTSSTQDVPVADEEDDEFILIPVKDEEREESSQPYCLVKKSPTLGLNNDKKKGTMTTTGDKRMIVRSATDQGAEGISDLSQNPDLMKALEAFVPGPVRDAIKSGGGSRSVGGLRKLTVIFFKLYDVTLPKTFEDEASRMGFLKQAQEQAQLVQESAYHYYATLRQLILDDKGFVAIVALGLPPFFFEDNAVRAIKVAQRLIGHHKIRAAAGVCTGTVFCGVVGTAKRAEYSVAGSCINLAARLMFKSGPGAIWCDQATKLEAESHISFEQMPSLTFKGFDQPVEIYAPRGIGGKLSTSSSSSVSSAALAGVTANEANSKATTSSAGTTGTSSPLANPTTSVTPPPPLSQTKKSSSFRSYSSNPIVSSSAPPPKRRSQTNASSNANLVGSNSRRGSASSGNNSAIGVTVGMEKEQTVLARVVNFSTSPAATLVGSAAPLKAAFLEGEAGSGKTKLIELAGAETNARIVTNAHPDASEMNTPFYAWRNILQDLLGLVVSSGNTTTTTTTTNAGSSTHPSASTSPPPTPSHQHPVNGMGIPLNTLGGGGHLSNPTSSTSNSNSNSPLATMRHRRTASNSSTHSLDKPASSLPSTVVTSAGSFSSGAPTKHKRTQSASSVGSSSDEAALLTSSTTTPAANEVPTTKRPALVAVDSTSSVLSQSFPSSPPLDALARLIQTSRIRNRRLSLLKTIAPTITLPSTASSAGVGGASGLNDIIEEEEQLHQQIANASNSMTPPPPPNTTTTTRRVSITGKRPGGGVGSGATGGGGSGSSGTGSTLNPELVAKETQAMEQARMAMDAFLLVLEEAGNVVPSILVLVDNAHNLDRQSWELLRRAVEFQPASWRGEFRVRFVVAYRPFPASKDHPLEMLFSHLALNGTTSSLALGGGMMTTPLGTPTANSASLAGPNASTLGVGGSANSSNVPVFFAPGPISTTSGAPTTTTTTTTTSTVAGGTSGGTAVNAGPTRTTSNLGTLQMPSAPSSPTFGGGGTSPLASVVPNAIGATGSSIPGAREEGEASSGGGISSSSSSSHITSRKSFGGNISHVTSSSSLGLNAIGGTTATASPTPPPASLPSSPANAMKNSLSRVASTLAAEAIAVRDLASGRRGSLSANTFKGEIVNAAASATPTTTTAAAATTTTLPVNNSGSSVPSSNATNNNNTSSGSPGLTPLLGHSMAASPLNAAQNSSSTTSAPPGTQSLPHVLAPSSSSTVSVDDPTATTAAAAAVPPSSATANNLQTAAVAPLPPSGTITLSDVARIQISPLSPRECAVYLSSAHQIVAGGRILSFLHRKSKGNPRALMDCFRALEEQAVIKVDANTGTVEELASLEDVGDLVFVIPSHLRAQLLQQFDKLATREQTILKVASVAGASASRSLLGFLYAKAAGVASVSSNSSSISPSVMLQSATSSTALTSPNNHHQQKIEEELDIGLESLRKKGFLRPYSKRYRRRSHRRSSNVNSEQIEGGESVLPPKAPEDEKKTRDDEEDEAEEDTEWVFENDHVRFLVYNQMLHNHRRVVHARVLEWYSKRRRSRMEADPSFLGSHAAGADRPDLAFCCFREGMRRAIAKAEPVNKALAIWQTCVDILDDAAGRTASLTSETGTFSSSSSPTSHTSNGSSSSSYFSPAFVAVKRAELDLLLGQVYLAHEEWENAAAQLASAATSTAPTASLVIEERRNARAAEERRLRMLAEAKRSRFFAVRAASRVWGAVARIWKGLRSSSSNKSDANKAVGKPDVERDDDEELEDLLSEFATSLPEGSLGEGKINREEEHDNVEGDDDADSDSNPEEEEKETNEDRHQREEESERSGDSSPASRTQRRRRRRRRRSRNRDPLVIERFRDELDGPTQSYRVNRLSEALLRDLRETLRANQRRIAALKNLNLRAGGF